MKSKFTHALRSIPVGSVPKRKGTTLCLNEGYFHLWLPNLVPTQGCQNVTGHGQSASTHTSQDSGELQSSNERDSSFPHSTPGVVPSIPNAYLRTNQSKPTCMKTGWRLQVT